MAHRSLPTFYPPGDSRFAERIGRFTMLPLMKGLFGIGRVEIDADDAERLREACRGPVLLCPNHPSLHEPVVVWEVLNRLDIRRNFAVALDTLRVIPILNRYMQALGCFSIRRGAPDRQAFATTRRLLAADRCVVMFPEGETSGLCDRLIPFRDGVAQLGFWGLQERREQGLEQRLRVVPMAVKYVFDRDPRATVDAAIERLERHLGIADGAGRDRYERLRGLGFATLAALAREYDIAVSADAALDEQIELVLGKILHRVSTLLEVTIESDETPLGNLRRLFAAVTRELYEHGDAKTPYEASLREQRRPQFRAVERELARLQTFQAVRDGYVAAYPSAERYLDVLGRLERDVIGKTPKYGRRRAVVTVGEPLELGDWLPAYEADRKQTVPAVTEALRERLSTLIEANVELAPRLAD